MTSIRHRAAGSITLCAAALFSVGLAEADEPLTLKFEGTVEPYQRVELANQVTAVVSKVLVPAGQRVEKGQLLFELDAEPFEIDVMTARAELDEAKARLRLAEDVAGRQEALAERGTGAQARAAQTGLEVEAARAAVARQASALKRAELAVARTRITAPIAGTMGRPRVAPGAFVEAEGGTILGEIVQLDPILVAYAVSYADRQRALEKAGTVTPGELFEHITLTLELPGGRAYPHRGKPKFESAEIDRQTGMLPPETIVPAMIAGVRYALNSPPVRSTLLRAAAFFVFASAFWALLPLIARTVLSGGAALYGVLLGALGAGAVAGALLLPRIKARLGPDRTVVLGTLGIAAVIVVMAVVPNAALAAAAAAVAGVAWIAVLSTLNVSAQTALPDWVRARGLSIFLTVFFGSMTAGSLLWGQLASLIGIPAALPLTRHAALTRDDTLDLTPSMHWPAPIVSGELAHDRGPVMIQVAYEIAEDDQPAFLDLMRELAAARRRGGGYGWSLMHDTETPTRFVETWYEASWVQHMRHHARVSMADRALQERIGKLHRGPAPPRAQHLVSVA